MVKVEMRIKIPIAVNDWLLDVARANRREGKGATSKEEIVKEIIQESFLINNK